MSGSGWTTAPPDPRVYALVAAAGLPGTLFNPAQHRACDLVDRYAVHVAAALLGELGLDGPLAAPSDADTLAAACGFVPRFRPALRWLLAFLAHADVLEESDGRYRLAAPLAPSERAALRDAGLAADPGYAPAYALLDEAAAIYPRAARGEVAAERALFQKVSLWTAYFDNAHGYYAVNNCVAAHGAARRVGDGRVLEVGAGLGSATDALLDALAAGGTSAALAQYRVTEPVPFFRRRAQRTLADRHAGVPLAFAALDVNAPWAAQGVAPQSASLVWGVNVLHLARSLPRTLGEARETLVPGGWLVAGEGVRPWPGWPVAAELPFQLLDAYVDVELDPETRPQPGFLTAEQWRTALDRAGFVDVAFVPDVVALRAIAPRLFPAAVCARRPNVR